MLRSNNRKIFSQFAIVSCFSLALLHHSGIPSVSYAQEGEERIEVQTEGEVTSRGIQKRVPRSTLRRSQPTQKSSTTAMSQQIAALQRQVGALQGQVNALRNIIRVSKGVATIQAQSLILRGDAIRLKSQKNDVSIESQKGIKIESKMGVDVKANVGINVEAHTRLNLKGSAMVQLQGALVTLNGGKKPVAGLGHQVHVPPGGIGKSVIGKIVKGSPTVLVP